MSSLFPENPFVGLRPYRTEESLLFFGRRQQTTELVEHLYRTHFLAVVGSSGCGKSSLVRAGLIPRLMAGFLVDQRDQWSFTTMTPGESPLARLAIGFSTTDTLLREEGAAQVIARLKEQPGASEKNCLLLVDQFEELFRFAVSPQHRDEAADFVSILLSLAEQREFPVFVVITMRSDFLGDCDAFYGLPEALNRSHYLVPRLTRQQRRETIEGPVKLHGKTVKPELVDRVLNDVGDEPDHLPVMQHALLRTWEQWKRSGSNGPLDLKHYTDIGGVREALARDADSALDGLAENDRELAAQIFQALTDTDASNRRVRRPARISELESITGASRARIASVIERFRGGGRSFLIVQEIPGSSDALIDISHESLIRQWTRLGSWADEESESKRTYLELVGAVERKRSLLHDSDLQLALDWRDRRKPSAAWARRYDPRFDEAMAFLDKSKAESDREASERTAQERIRRRLATALQVLSVLLLAVLGYFGYVVLDKQRQVDAALADAASTVIDARREAEARIATANDAAQRIQAEAAASLTAADLRLSEADAELDRTQADNRFLLLWSQAAENFRETPETFEASGLLAIEALRADPSSNQARARNVLMNVLNLLPPRPRRFEREHRGGVTAMATDASGQILLTAGADKRVVVWDLMTQSRLRTLDDEIDGAPGTLAVSPDKRWVAAAAIKAIYVWDLATGRQVARLPHENVPSMAFSPDGERLALAIINANYRSPTPGPRAEYSTANWQQIPLNEPANVREVAFSPQGVLALVVNAPNQARSMIKLSNRAAPVEGSEGCHSLSFEGDGTFFAACPNGVFRFYPEEQAGVESPPVPSTREAAIEFRSFAVHREDPFVFAGRTASNEFKIYDPAESVDLYRLPEAVSAFAISPVSNWLVTGNEAGAVLFWPLDRAAVAHSITYTGDLADLTFSPNENDLVVAETEGRVRVFNPVNGRELRSLDLDTELIRPMFSPDGSVLGLLGPSKLHLLNSSDWSVLRRDLQGEQAGGISFTFTTNSRLLLLAEMGRVLRFQVRPWTALSPLQLGERENIFVSHDRRWIGQGPPPVGDVGPERFRFWNVETGAATPWDAMPQGLGLPGFEDEEDDEARAGAPPRWLGLFPRGPLEDADISGDLIGGRWFIDGGLGGVQVKETGTNNLVADLGPASHWAFSRNGKWIVTADSIDDQVILRIWPWDLDLLLQRACELLPRNLTTEEWRRFDLERLGLGSHRDTCTTPAVRR